MLLLVLKTSGCANLPNKPICAEVNISKGKCSYLVTGKTITVDDDHLLDGQTWFDIRNKSLTMPADTWAAIRAWILKMCKKYKCNIDVASWDRSVEIVDEAIGPEAK